MPRKRTNLSRKTRRAKKAAAKRAAAREKLRMQINVLGQQRGSRLNSIYTVGQGEQIRNSQNKNHYHTSTVKIEEPEPEKNSKLDRVIQPQFEKNAIPEISNLPEAMNYLRALMNYALLQDNFRAIGLLTKVEEVIRNPPNSQDFEEP